MNGKIIATKLHQMRAGILGVQNNPEIQAKMNPFGYTPERMGEGKSLLDKVTRLMITNVEEYSDKSIATDNLWKFWEKSYGNYMITLKVTRVAFVGQPELLQRFSATGRRSRSLSGWLREAKILYSNLLNSQDILNVLAGFGYSAEKLNREFQDISTIEELYSKQLSEKSSAQQSTVERDEAFDALCKWFSSFRAIARIALYDKPQLLEALSIRNKS